MIFFGLDLGTTGCKGMAFNEEGGLIAECYIEYPLIINADGLIEQDALLWRSLIFEVIKKLSVDCSESPVSLAVSSQGISFVPVDMQFKPLCNALSWLSSNALEESRSIEDKFTREGIYRRTGKIPGPAYSLPKIMWLKKNRSSILQKTYKLLMGLDYIGASLTGTVLTDYTMASGTMCYDLNKYEWASDMLDFCGIPGSMMPDVGRYGTCVGSLTGKTADELGLGRGVKVILGAQDQKCAAIGAGIQEGICTVSMGTATAVSFVSSSDTVNSKMRLPVFALDRQRKITEGVVITSGAALKWLKDTFFQDNTYASMDNEAQKSSPLSNGVVFLPWLDGEGTPGMNHDLRGVISGFGLTTKKGDIIRALYEGISYRIKENIEEFKKAGGITTSIYAFGGGSKSRIWCRILADVTGLPVVVPEICETANYGAAMMAAEGAAGLKLPHLASREVFCPESAAVNIYKDGYAKFTEIRCRKGEA